MTPPVALAAPEQSNAQSTSSHSDKTRLVDAIQRQDFEAARDLLDAGAVDVDSPQADGATAIAWAAHWDALDTARRLIQTGANVNAANELGVTPLMLAAHNGSPSMVETLLTAGADPNATRPSGDSSLMVAARVGNADVRATPHTRRRKSKQDDHRWPHRSHVGGLRGACRRPHRRSSTREPGSSTSAPSSSDHSSGWATRVSGSWCCYERERRRTLPSSLRDGDGDPPRTQGGFTPLLYAVLGGHEKTVQVLVDEGVDVRESSPDGVSALMLALTKRHEELALFLIEQGADPNFDSRDDVLQSNPHLADGQDPLAVEPAEDAADYAGYTALHLAAATGQHAAMRALLARGADPNARMDRPKRFVTAFEIGVFASPGAGRLTQLGSTPFIVAAKAADAEGMRILAEAGADPFATTADGTTALTLAAGLGKRAASDITYYDWDQVNAIEAVQVALDRGIDINAANEWGETALHGATYHAADELIRFLVKQGANIDATNWENQTPVRLAKGHMICCTTYVEHPQIATLLLELGADPEVGKQVTFGLLGYHSENKDGNDGAGDVSSGEPR